MNDIIMTETKQLQELYKQKTDLEAEGERLKVQRDALMQEGHQEEIRGKENLTWFDNAVAAYKSASTDWWKQFYSKHSSETVQANLTSSLSEKVNLEKQLQESQKIDTPEFQDNLERAKKIQEENRRLRASFSLFAALRARKAMCYNVCFYTDSKTWTLKPFDDDRDWGLHLCPNGVKPSMFEWFFMLANPIGYWDLLKSAHLLPRQYAELLESHNQMLRIKKRMGLRSMTNPAGELEYQLKKAKEIINKNTIEIKHLENEIDGLQKLYALVGHGQDGFLKQWFGPLAFLAQYRDQYKKDMALRLSKLPDYTAMKQLYDGLVANLFDFKEADANVSGYVMTERQKIEKTYTSALFRIQHKSFRAESQIKSVIEEIKRTEFRIQEIRANYKNSLVERTKKDPASTFFYPANGWLEDNSDRVVKQMEEVALQRGSLTHIPAYRYELFGDVEEPYLDSVDCLSGNAVNLIVKPLHEDAQKPDAELWAASNLITSILFSMPIGSLHFTFIDLDTTGVHKKLMSTLDPEAKLLYSLVTDTAELRNVQSEYKKRQTIEGGRTEIVVWVSCMSADAETIAGDLKQIFINGTKSNYFTIAVPIKDETEITDESEKAYRKAEAILAKFRFREIYAPGEDFNIGRDKIVNALRNYTTNPERKRPSVYWDMLDKGPRQEKIGKEGIRIPIGVNKSNTAIEAYWEYECNNPELQHTMIIGRSGQGKSFLLHNILLNAMMTYSADELEFYAMDFKDGVEFNRYKEVAHISHILLNGTDFQTVYAILKHLNDEEMSSRKEKFKEMEVEMHTNCKDISRYNELVDEYNLTHPERPKQRMKHVILLVDECQKLFESENRKLADGIKDVIQNIASQGRVQGVTFIFASQNLHSIKERGMILKNANNRYLMRVTDSAEAGTFIERGDIKNKDLERGIVCHSNEMIRVYNYTGRTNHAYDNALESIKMKYRDKKKPVVFDGKYKRQVPMTPHHTLRAFVGISTDADLHDTYVDLEKEAASNILITGVNDKMQAERILFSTAFSMINCYRQGSKRIRITIFDNNLKDDKNASERDMLLRAIEQNDDVRVMRSDNEKLSEIARLARQSRHEQSTDEVNILFILAHERMKDHLLENKLIVQEEYVEKQADNNAYHTDDEIRALFNTDKKRVNEMSREEKRKAIGVDSGLRSPQTQLTVENELLYILEKGGNRDVHVVMQVDSPENIATDPYTIQESQLAKWFGHLIVLRLSDTASRKLPNLDNPVSRLNDDVDRLRAVYYKKRGNHEELIIPYQLPDKQTISEITNIREN